MDLEGQKIILELDTYIASCENRLETILSALDWTEDDTLKESTCSRKYSEELKIDEDDPSLPESFDCMHSIVIGEDQLKAILKTDNVSIPKKFSDIQLNYTREQKREIYDYVIFNTGKISEPELKVSVSNDNNDMTFAEIVAKAKKKDKNLKRKYRTSKPTHIEEVRNLVNLQMQALEQYFNPKSSITEAEERRKCEDYEHGERNRHRSRSRSKKRWRSPYRKKSRSRSKVWKKQSQERVSRNVGNARRLEESTSRDRRSKSVNRTQNKKEKHHRRRRSRSSISATSHSRNYESYSSHRKKKSNQSLTKKHKKGSRSRSKCRHKSSKSKKQKH